jgi:hypothetical protein
VTDKGVIYQNPTPTLKPDQATMPGLVWLSDREFLCVFRRAPASEAIDAFYGICRSTDGGRTYVDQGLLWDPKGDDRAYSYVYAYPTLMPDGALILAGSRWDRSGEDWQIYNPITLGGLPIQSLIFTSRDGGRTWTPPQVVVSPQGRMANSSGRIIPLKDGRLLLPVETWKAYDDPNPPMQSSLALFSSDGAKTWKDYAVVAHDPRGCIIYWNGMFTRLRDGRLFVMYWTKDYQSGKDLTIHATWSEDEGRTWTEPYDTGILGQMGSSIDVGAGRVLAAYNRRDMDNPGIYAAVSEDGGRTWPPFGEHTVIWDARGRDIIGNRDQEHTGLFDEGLFAFGKPDALLLPDGTVYIGYWATSNFVSHLRWCRVQVKEPRPISRSSVASTQLGGRRA